MEVEKLRDFLKNCCRVCLSVENEMVESSNIVENFNKTIDQLLLECANLKMSNGSNYPQKLCEHCTTELVMIAKFREKCEMSTNALEQIKRQINKIQCRIVENETLQIEPVNIQVAKDEQELGGGGNSETFYENIEYADDNVEYVIYDTNADFLDETGIPERSHDDSVQRNEIFTEHIEEEIIEEEEEEEENTYNSNFKSIKKKTTPTKNQTNRNKIKRYEVIESKLTTKSIIKYHCKLCGAGFAQINNLRRHMQTHDDNDNVEQNSIIERDDAEYNVDESAHQTGNVMHQGSSSTNSMEQKTTNKKSLQKNHGCQYCNRAFPSLSLLATHTRIHTGERPFQCDFEQCLKSFKTQGALDLHVRRHSGIKPYKCSMCNRGFVESSNLKVHMRTHTGEKNHHCTTCGRSFSRVFLLQIHQRTHTGEKPFSCEVCSKSFAQQGDLAAHKRIHSGERPHKCKICHKGFIKSSGLTQHMRRHLRSTPKADSNAANPIGRNEQIEKVMICYKEFSDNAESLDEIILQD